MTPSETLDPHRAGEALQCGEPSLWRCSSDTREGPRSADHGRRERTFVDMDTIEYLGAHRRVVEEAAVGVRPSFFAPENLYPADLLIVESRPGWFTVLSVSHDGGSVRQIGEEQPTLEDARAVINLPDTDR